MTSIPGRKKVAKSRRRLPLKGRVRSVHFNSLYVCFLLRDRREINVPLGWFPKLHRVTHDTQREYVISEDGRTVSWPDLDESVSLSDLNA